jgi:cyclase
MNAATRVRPHRLAASMFALALAVGGSQARAQEVQKLAPGAWVLIGKSCNVVIVPGPEGALIVDDQGARDFDETMAAVRQVSTGPVRYVVNTHWHLDHSGGDEAFARAGAVIVAQHNVRVRRGSAQFMPAYNVHIPASTAAALPAVVYDDRLELHVGDETISLRHAPGAHTDGDTLVRIEGANVLHLGDVYFNGIFHFIDRASDGGIKGLIRAVDMALAMSDDQTRIVPGHGPVATKAELKAYRDMLQDVCDRVGRAIKARKTMAEIVASKPAAAYRKGMEGEEDRFVEAIYDSLTKA